MGCGKIMHVKIQEENIAHYVDVTAFHFSLIPYINNLSSFSILNYEDSKRKHFIIEAITSNRTLLSE